MKEFIEKLIGRLEEEILNCQSAYAESIIGMCGTSASNYISEMHAFEKTKKIVNQLAEEYKPTTNSNIQEVIDNLEVYTVGRLKSARVHITVEELQNQIDRLEQLAEEYGKDKNVRSNGWIPCSERLPERENKYGWVSCIVSVIRTHYPTSTYDICDSPYDENIVMHANYDVSQKIWHLECDEQLNALIDIEDAPLNSDYVTAWMPLPPAYVPKEGRE